MTDLVSGDVFNQLTAVAPAPSRRGRCWLFRCSCGVELVRPVHTVLSGRTRSCGCLRAISGLARRQDYTGCTLGWYTVLGHAPDRTGSQGRRFPRIRVVCRCGTRREIDLGALLSGNTLSCGCYALHLRRSRTGPANHMYDATISDEDRASRENYNRPDHRVTPVRARARARDNYICQSCGGRGCVVHHIKPWRSFRNHRYCLWNMITLCGECHAAFHYDYGYNNPGNYRDFVPWLRARRERHGYKQHAKVRT